MNKNYVYLLILVCAALVSACGEKTSSPTATKAPAMKAVTEASSSAVTVIPGMVYIPAGDFIMGNDDIDISGKSKEFGFNEPWYLPEHPKRSVNLDAYYIDRYEVSNLQFRNWLISLKRFSPATMDAVVKRLQLENGKLPVRGITWSKAQEFCYAVGKHLPTEAEWEKAARGTDGREYPWGDEWNKENLNAGQNEENLTAGGTYEAGKSPFGVYDMAGNVMEWTASWYDAYPGAKYQSPNYGRKHKVARGGSWGGVGHYVIPHYFRVAYRFNFQPDGAYNDVGFRCAKDT